MIATRVSNSIYFRIHTSTYKSFTGCQGYYFLLCFLCWFFPFLGILHSGVDCYLAICCARLDAFFSGFLAWYKSIYIQQFTLSFHSYFSIYCKTVIIISCDVHWLWALSSLISISSTVLCDDGTYTTKVAILNGFPIGFPRRSLPDICHYPKTYVVLVNIFRYSFFSFIFLSIWRDDSVSVAQKSPFAIRDTDFYACEHRTHNQEKKTPDIICSV